jgi:putative membrane protein
MAVVVCALLAVLYWLGGRRPLRLIDARPRWGARQWRASAFLGGLAIIAISLSGPVDALVRQTFWMRTVQLIVVVMVAAPLLVLGAPHPRIRRLLGSSGRGSARPSRVGAVLAFTLFNGALLLAYVPSVYAATASPGWSRQLAQLGLTALGFFFWSEVIAQPPGRCALSHVERVFYLFLSSAQVRIVGLILGFASASFYGSSLFEQQLAAGILLVPGVLTDLIVLTVCLYLWLGQDDRQPAERFDGGQRAAAAAGNRRILANEALTGSSSFLSQNRV